MGSELLTEDEDSSEIAPRSYTEQFYEAFPQYLAMGMTTDDYWNGDSDLPKYFRKAYRQKQEHENFMAWLQGAYVYDAIAAVSPVLNAFAQKGTKVQPYLKKPYAIYGEAEKTPQQKKAEFLARWEENKAKWKLLHQ